MENAFLECSGLTNTYQYCTLINSYWKFNYPLNDKNIIDSQFINSTLDFDGYYLGTAITSHKLTNCYVNNSDGKYLLKYNNSYGNTNKFNLTFTNNYIENQNSIFQNISTLPILHTKVIQNNTWLLPNGTGFSQITLTDDSLSNQIISNGMPFKLIGDFVDTQPIYGKIPDVSYILHSPKEC